MNGVRAPLRLAADSDARLHSIIDGLKGYRALLEASADLESVGLLSIVILQLEMRAHRIQGPELEELCHAAEAQLERASRPADKPVPRMSSSRPPKRDFLKIVD